MGKSTRFAIEHGSTTARLPQAQDTQSEQFVKAARELGCDESEERFNDALKAVAKHKPREATPAPAPRTKAKP
jgi:hypothetical protein